MTIVESSFDSRELSIPAGKYVKFYYTPQRDTDDVPGYYYGKVTTGGSPNWWLNRSHTNRTVRQDILYIDCILTGTHRYVNTSAHWDDVVEVLNGKLDKSLIAKIRTRIKSRKSTFAEDIQ